MQHQPLVVMTYPGHFLHTALTMQSYFRHHETVPVTIIADDLSDDCWPSYIKDCEDFYKHPIIPMSAILPTKSFRDGWTRQQIAKLYLDQVLPYDTWFFTDGDIEYCFPAPTNAIPYAITRGGRTQILQNNYVSKLLGISKVGIKTDHPDMNWVSGTSYYQVCVSNPPFRTMTAKTLQQLRIHVENLHNNTLEGMHRSGGIYRVGCKEDYDRYSVSEWELIANFQINLLKENVPLVYYPTAPPGTPATSQKYNFCITDFGSRTEYSRDWWNKQDVTVPDTIWNNLLKITR